MSTLGPLVGHVALTLVLAPLVVVLGLAAATARRRSATERRTGAFGVDRGGDDARPRGGRVLALFVVSQLVALTGAGDRLIASAGLTPAEYARSGFFQLCWATGLLLAFLAAGAALADPDAARPAGPCGASAPRYRCWRSGWSSVSLRRMALYDEAFGLTMLRLWVVGAAFWMGAVLLMTAARNLGAGPAGDWLVAGAGLAAVVLVVVADVADPEAFVVRHNLARAQAGAELDLAYLFELSDDAVPALADGLDDGRVAVRCAPPPHGVAALNLAVAHAEGVRRDACRR